MLQRINMESNCFFLMVGPGSFGKTTLTSRILCVQGKISFPTSTELCFSTNLIKTIMMQWSPIVKSNQSVCDLSKALIRTTLKRVEACKLRIHVFIGDLYGETCRSAHFPILGFAVRHRTLHAITLF